MAVVMRSNIPPYGQRTSWVPRRPEVGFKLSFESELIR